MIGAVVGGLLLSVSVAVYLLRVHRHEIVLWVAKECLVLDAGWKAQEQAEAEARKMRVGLEEAQRG
jgi:hypothetical protein